MAIHLRFGLEHSLAIGGAKMVRDLQAIFVAGGFFATPCVTRLKKSFFVGRVAAILSPPYPGSAVCCSAVTMGIWLETFLYKIAKRTYGQFLLQTFIDGVHPKNLRIEGDIEEFSCNGVFRKFRVQRR